MWGEYESGGDGWWVASDGLWYPPESHPDAMGHYWAPSPEGSRWPFARRRIYRILATGLASLMAAALLSGLAAHRVSEDAAAALGIGAWILLWVVAWRTWGHVRRKVKGLPVWAWASLGCFVAFGLFSADDPTTDEEGPAIAVNVQPDGAGAVERAAALPTSTAISTTAVPLPAATTAVAPTAVLVPPTATAVPPTSTAVPPTPTTAPPTPTRVPPTPTAVPPTSTAVPPTATAVPPTAVPPTSPPVPPPPTAAPQPVAPPASQDCTPGYDPCIPLGPDVDCAGGSGNGPRYVGRVTVTGSDPYDLDRDNDGVGCE